MAVFEGTPHDGELDYDTLRDGGLVSIHAGDDAGAVRRWLDERGYRVEVLDFAHGFDRAAEEIDRVFRWKASFGYDYVSGRRGLDALSDGFCELDVPDAGGLVLVLDRPDLLWREQRPWVDTFLEVASRRSQRRILEGRRFFTVLVVAPDAALLGADLHGVHVPRVREWKLPSRRPASTTREVVAAYFAAWTERRIDDAYALLADDLHFAGPNATYATAAEFKPALIGFAQMTRGARVVELVVDGDRAALLYDCDLPDPVGTLRIASFFRIAGGRIAWYETQFDASALRPLLAARRIGVE